MIVIEKVRQYLRSISSSEEDYQKRLGEVWINSRYRNAECPHSECKTCEDCPMNHLTYTRRRNCF